MRNALRYDVLVVGAGPAGASAAAAAAGRRHRVLMIDRRKVVGVPIQCAEYIPAPLVGNLGLGRDYIVQPVRGMKTFLAGREVKTTLSPGFIIRRDKFDQALVQAACDSGAEIRLQTRAVVKVGDEVVVKAKGGHPEKIAAKVIIGADGPLSTVAGWIGADRPEPLRAAQACVRLRQRLDFAEVYFEKELFGGYAWLFPRGDQANLGLGIRKAGERPPPLGSHLDSLISRFLEAGKIAAPRIGTISGWIPAGPATKFICGNVLLVGDAAGQTHPITGAGIFPAVTAGAMAGLWAARAIASSDLQKLAGYEAEYRDLFGDWMQRAVDRRLFMETHWEELDKILKYAWVAFKEYYARDF